MAKVKHPLFSGDVSGAFGKKMIFKKGGIVTRMFWPRNPRTAAQQRQREIFKEFSMPSLTQEQADLLYSAILHQHDDLYSSLGHGHDHGGLLGLADDDHPQYYNQTRGDVRYAFYSHLHQFDTCRAVKSGNQAIVSGFDVRLTLENEDFDNVNMHNLLVDNSRITIKRNGSYAVFAYVVYSTNSIGIRSTQIYKNGTAKTINTNNAVVVGNHQVGASDFFSCVQNDYLELNVYQTSGVSLNVVAASLSVIQLF